MVDQSGSDTWEHAESGCLLMTHSALRRQVRSDEAGTRAELTRIGTTPGAGATPTITRSNGPALQFARMRLDYPTDGASDSRRATTS